MGSAGVGGAGPFTAPDAPLDGTAQSARRRWRILVFSGTWVAYAAYYLTRKNYAIAQPAFMAELGWTKEQVGTIITGYLTVYAIGQFVNGLLGDRLGSRVMLGFGFVLTALLSFLLGFGESIGWMAIVYGLNGYAQSTGWPSVTRAMTNWFTVEERGRVMGLWGTNYPVGEALATAFATFVLATWGWRAVFWGPAAVSIMVGAAVVLAVRDHPRDVGLTRHGAPVTAQTPPKQTHSSFTQAVRHFRDLRVLTIGVAYFCLKFVRYTFIFWIGIYLVEKLGFTAEEAGYLQVPFPLFGLAGSVIAGFLSDKLFNARRAPVAAMMLAGLAAGLFVFLILPKSSIAVSVTLAFIGIMTFGPDMLFSAAAAMDFGSEEAAATVTGFVNGLGSIGAALSGTVVGYVAGVYGWTSVFYILIGMAIACIAVTLPIWNARGE